MYSILWYGKYSENSRFDAGPPVQILKELENNVLVLADIEISDDDVPVLARFFNHPQVWFLFFSTIFELTGAFDNFAGNFGNYFLDLEAN